MDAVWHTWWAWVIGGLLLGILEMLLPTGYILLGFAGGAVLTGLLIALDIVGVTLPQTLLAFAVLSAVSWVILRALFGRPATEQKKIWTKDINDNNPPSP